VCNTCVSVFVRDTERVRDRRPTAALVTRFPWIEPRQSAAAQPHRVGRRFGSDGVLELSRAWNQPSTSLSSHPTALCDKRRGGGKRSSFTIRQISDREIPTRFRTSVRRSMRGAAGELVAGGIASSYSFHSRPRLTDNSSCASMRSRASLLMRLAISLHGHAFSRAVRFARLLRL
jgi:hypothetical protein